jgi:hypothetical protein
MKNRIYTALVSITLASAPTLAWGYDIDLGPLGHACDTCGGGVIGGLPIIGRPLNEAAVTAAGRTLAQWIIASHNTAIGTAMPIPPYIRQKLTGYASEDSMNRVRYKIGDNGFANLANALEKGGYASAVTLIDVVVFRGPSEFQDLSTWAHELTHVDQYAQWGVNSFAVQYVRNFHSVEDPAYAKGNGYRAWAQQHGLGPTPVGFPGVLPPAYPAPAQQQGYGAFCYTQFGRFGPGPMQPFGARCNVNGGWGQIGM